MLDFFDQLRRKMDGSAQANESPRPAEIQIWMQQRIGEALDVPGESLDPTQPITSYGLDSITGFTLTSELADWLGRELPAELLWEHPTIVQLAQHLGEGTNR